MHLARRAKPARASQGEERLARATDADPAGQEMQRTGRGRRQCAELLRHTGFLPRDPWSAKLMLQELITNTPDERTGS